MRHETTKLFHSLSGKEQDEIKKHWTDAINKPLCIAELEFWGGGVKLHIRFFGRSGIPHVVYAVENVPINQTKLLLECEEWFSTCVDSTLYTDTNFESLKKHLAEIGYKVKFEPDREDFGLLIFNQLSNYKRR